jgi:hypothetical protein
LTKKHLATFFGLLKSAGEKFEVWRQEKKEKKNYLLEPS